MNGNEIFPNNSNNRQPNYSSNYTASLLLLLIFEYKTDSVSLSINHPDASVEEFFRLNFPNL